MTYHSILQWNCRGIKANFNELHILLQECNIGVLCLQETKLSPNSSLYLKRYSSYHVYSKNISDGHPSGGVSTFIHNSIPHRGVATGGYIGIYTLPKSVPENYFVH